MKIKRLVIENFKSIERIELVEPNPFTVFVGPNGSGKSNIFEALEFVNIDYISGQAINFFGADNIRRRVAMADSFSFLCDLEEFIVVKPHISERTAIKNDEDSKPLYEPDIKRMVFKYVAEYQQYINNFSRIFVRNSRIVKQSYKDETKLSLDAQNLERVLKRILTDKTLRNEVFEWLELFVPGFKAVEVDDRDELHWFEESLPDYFTTDLISDGTYNILAMLAAVYQSDDSPQFLCIEEPENGLHPQVARELVDFFRIMCKERGHFIWLNTHSQSMASRVRAEELVIVEKKDGATQTRQFKDRDFHGMRADEAWLTNSLGGGLAW